MVSAARKAPLVEIKPEASRSIESILGKLRVLRVMNKRQRKFEKMVQALSSDLYRYAYMLCRNEAMAEDLVQETFMRAWRFLDSLRDESKAKSWLMTTVRREFARQFERYRPVFEDADLDQIPGGREFDPEVWTLRRALATLPEKYGWSGESVGNSGLIPVLAE